MNISEIKGTPVGSYYNVYFAIYSEIYKIIGTHITCIV